MLAILPHGVCVDPDAVKIINIRTDRQPGAGGALTFTVAIRTDADDNWISVAAFDNRAEAEALSAECARRINGDEASDEADDEDEDEDEPAPKPAAAKPPPVDDDW